MNGCCNLKREIETAIEMLNNYYAARVNPLVSFEAFRIRSGWQLVKIIDDGYDVGEVLCGCYGDTEILSGIYAELRRCYAVDGNNCG